ncbi:unnamed protein product [Ectocarpus sp. 12 AP-2014]
MVAKGDVMGAYCFVTFFGASILFGVKHLLLRDATFSRLSKAADYVPAVEIAAWVLTWYGVSVSMVMANRWLFYEWQGVGFPFPVLTTMVHMWLKVLVTRVMYCLKGEKPPHLDVSVNLRTIIPIGLATAGDILLSNLSFMVATVAFYTIVKSGSLIWILLWAVVFRFEALTPKMVSVVLITSAGLFMASLGETDFSTEGLLLILGASCLSGLRWGLLQLLQAIEPSCHDPLLVIYYIAPSSAIAMTPMALLDILDENLKGAAVTPGSIAQVAAVILGTGLFSFALIFAEVKLLAITSSLTMGVFGTVKEIVQIVLAVLVFNEQVTWFNLVGLGWAIVGSMLYKISRAKPSARNGEGGGAKDARRPAHNGQGDEKANAGVNMPYSAVSQQEVDEELRVFKYENTEWELEGELEEFSSFDGGGR